MASRRRIGVEGSKIRAQLIEAARKIVAEDGCSAVTARRLADEVRLSRHIVHYYFGTIEELFIAMMRMDADVIRERISEALKSREPLRVIWDSANQSIGPVLELTAMAIRSEALGEELRGYITEFRRLTAQALSRHLELLGRDPIVPPEATTLIFMSISQTMAIEKALGVRMGHAETQALIESCLRAFADRGEWIAAAPVPKQPKARGKRRARASR